MELSFYAKQELHILMALANNRMQAPDADFRLLCCAVPGANTRRRAEAACCHEPGQ